jgi:hypothetical protein
MNRLKEASLENTAKARLALAYSYAGKNDVAKSILTTIPVEIAPYIDDRYTYGSHHLDNAYMLELFVKLGDQS